MLIFHIELNADGRDSWRKLLDTGLARSRVSAEEFGKLVRFYVAYLSDEARRGNATDILVRLASFWPEFQVGNETRPRSLTDLATELAAAGGDDNQP